MFGRPTYWCGRCSGMWGGGDGGECGGRLFLQLGHWAFESDLEDLVHLLDEVQLHGVLQELGEVGQVALVLGGQDGFEDAGAVGGEELLLQAADGEHLAAQGDLAGHGDVAADGDLGERAGERGGQGDAGGGAVLGDGAFGDVDVDVEVAVEVAGEAEVLGAGADVGERGLRGLLHDVAELAGEGELAFAVEHLDFGLRGCCRRPRSRRGR